MIALIISLLMLVLGNEIQAAVSKYVPFLGRIIARILGARAMLVFGVLFVVFLMLYKVLPNRKATFKSQIPGAFLIAIAWSVFSYGFSFILKFFQDSATCMGILRRLSWLWYGCMSA